ncbi:MAG: hypothetical protein JO352_21185 [Chloroflexi bacterium]|nr:hypothetical protein [Chloroflexota bacterium]
MAASPEDTEREIVRLRGDMIAAVAEVERRFRGGLRGVATAEARVTSARAREDAIAAARDNPTVLGVAGVVAVAAIAYGAYVLVRGIRERRKPTSRLRRGVSQLGAELSERVSGGVESSRRQLERTLPHGILLKLEPGSGGYMRVRDARLESPSKGRDRAKVIKKLVWAGFLSVFLAVGSVLARRLADSAWRAMVREEPPTGQPKE